MTGSLFPLADLRDPSIIVPYKVEEHVKVAPEVLAALVEVVDRAHELTRYIGDNGAPDLRNRVAKLDVALERFDFPRLDPADCPHARRRFLRTRDLGDDGEEDIYECQDCGQKATEYAPR